MSGHKTHQRGFTIVELLIVIVVIGILAAVTIIAFNGAKNKAVTAAVKTSVEGSSKQIELFRAQSTQYPTAIDCTATPAANTICVKNDTNVNYSYSYSSSSNSFCLEGSSPIGSVIPTFNYSSKNGTVQEGSCPGGWTAIWAGYESTCGVANGTLYCWGNNQYGKIGDGTTVNRTSPVAITTPFAASTITKVVSGWMQTCAIASGTAYCWGTNEDGQLGLDFSPHNTYLPNAVNAAAGQPLNGKTVTDIAPGIQNTCAVASGQFICWGKNGNGEVGDGTGNNQFWPVAVNTSGVLSGKTAQKVGGTVYYGSCNVASGAVYCWGSNGYGTFGNGTSGNSSLVPIATTSSGALSGKTVTDIAQTSQEVCVVASSAGYCWGSSLSGDGTNTYGSTVPVAMDTVGGDLKTQPIQALSIAGNACALSSGKLYCWGNPPWLSPDGTHSADTVYSPTKAPGDLGNVSFTSIFGTNSHTCGLSTAGFAYCWGPSFQGETGNLFGTLVSGSNAYKFAAP
jgi:prepilin-type N-terminal cleavage/methylation domain-containing protein